MKDVKGQYLKPPEAPPKAPEAPLTGSLDDILARQLTALERVTRQLVLAASSGSMSKEEIQSLATCIKVTLELKSVQNDLLEELSDEELRKAAE